MSLKARLRTIFMCAALELGVLSGVPMRPEEIRSLMNQINQPQLAHVLPTADQGGDDPPPGSPRGEIGQRMVNPSPDVTRIIDRLARRGLVRRQRGRTDRRLSLTLITPKGRALMERAEAANRAQREALAARLSPDEWRQLSALCERIYEPGE